MANPTPVPNRPSLGAYRRLASESHEGAARPPAELEAEAAGNFRQLPTVPKAPPAPLTTWTATDLMAAEFPEPRYAVDGLIAEGLSVLAGAPKAGKSWFAMNIAVAIASGGRALGKIPVEQGEVLYLALEDNGRRLQRRLKMVLDGAPPPPGLHFYTEWPRLDEGVSLLDLWLSKHPDARLVIIDVFARVRPISTTENTGIYASDYAAITPLKELADSHRVSNMLLHHTRKAKAEDFLDTLSGTQGLAGAADAVLVMTRARNAADSQLNVTGRDIEEAAHAMKFDPSRGLWTLLDGPAADYSLTPTQQKILKLLRAGPAMKTKQIAEAIGLDYELVKKSVQRMADNDLLATDGRGTYSPVPNAGQAGTSGDRGNLSPASPLSPDFNAPHAPSLHVEQESLISNFRPLTEGDSGDSGDRGHVPDNQGTLGPCWGCDSPTWRRDEEGHYLCHQCDPPQPKGTP